MLLACRPYGRSPWSPVQAMTVTTLIKLLTYGVLSSMKQTEKILGALGIPLVLPLLKDCV